MEGQQSGVRRRSWGRPLGPHGELATHGTTAKMPLNFLLFRSFFVRLFLNLCGKDNTVVNIGEWKRALNRGKGHTA